MGELLAAIVALFQATPALATAWPGGIWPDRADESADREGYVAYTVIAAPVDQTFSADPFTAVIQFDGLSMDRNAIAAAMQTLADTLDAADLVLATGQHYGTRRTMGPMPGPGDEKEEKKGHAARGQAHWLVVYEFDVVP